MDEKRMPIRIGNIWIILARLNNPPTAFEHNLLEKYPTVFCENLVDFNEARLHEATLILHTQA